MLRHGLVCLGLALALACPAMAQKPKKRRPAPPAAAAAPAAPAPPPTLRPLTPQLRSAVHSSSSRSTAVIARSTTGQCRAACSERRVVCLANPDDASACGPPWTQCLSDCAGLGYSRAPR